MLAETSVYAEVTIAARNGGQLDDPAHVLVSVEREVDATTVAGIEEVVRRAVAGATTFAARFLAAEPLARFREGVPL